MTPPHIWENVLVHSATLFTPTGDKVRLSREEPAQALERYQRYLCQGEGRPHTCQVGRWGVAPPPRGEHDQPHGPDDGVDQPQNFTPSRSAVMMRPTSARWSIGMGPAGMLTAPLLKMTLMCSAGSNTVGLPSAA